jgi:UPF0755 protein
MKGKSLLALVIVLALLGGAYLVFHLMRTPTTRLTLVPGRSLWEVAEKLESAGFGTRSEVLSLGADGAWVQGLGLPAKAREPRGDGVDSTWLEGFVFPDTYEVAEGTSAKVVLQKAINRFEQVWGELSNTYEDRLEALEHSHGLTESDIIILASLVEEEMAVKTEAPTIAGVFLNRLAKGMRLETDPTLMYRPDRVGKPPSPNERRDASNPYNTYAHKGLPPGPICSPSRAALEGVLTARTHDYLFFVARRDGTRGHAFAKTFEEHRANIERYLKKKRSP